MLAWIGARESLPKPGYNSRVISPASTLRAGLRPLKSLLALLILCLAACARPDAAPQTLPPAFETLLPRPTFTATRPIPPTAVLPPSPVVTDTRHPTRVPPRTPPRTPTAIPSLTALAAPATPTLPATCRKQPGSFEAGSLETTLLRLPLNYRVYLPPCYAQQPDRHYPVLYLIHGQGFQDDQWQRIGAGQTADRLIAAGEIAPLLIVMPYERYPGQPWQSNFDQAMLEVLLPYIDSAYRTLPERAYRAIGGLSRGAGWAVHLGLGWPDQFSAIGAHSPAVFVSDFPQLDQRLQALTPADAPRVYVDVGERDRPEIIQSGRELSDLLNRFDVTYEWHLFFGYHNEAYWSAHVEQYLRWYAQDW